MYRLLKAEWYNTSRKRDEEHLKHNIKRVVTYHEKGLIPMKKKMKNTRKKARAIRNGSYTPGRNAFGEKAETHFIVLERETAFEQILDAILSLDESKNKKEFTFDWSNFAGHEDEIAEVMAKVQAAREMLFSMRDAA